MAFSPLWLDFLLNVHLKGNQIATSRLIESGKLRSGRHGVSKDFGRSPESFDEPRWLKYVRNARQPTVMPGGLFMPVLFDTETFRKSEGYPEGNIYEDGAGTLNGPVLESGDAWYFRHLQGWFGLRHMTCFDSLVYHIQEGEMDE
jgi:hypothetical protein